MEGFLKRELSPQQYNSILTLELCVILYPLSDKPQNCYVILTNRELLLTDGNIPPKVIFKRLGLHNVVSIKLGKKQPLFLEKKYQDCSTHIEIVFEDLEKRKQNSLFNSPLLKRALSASKLSPSLSRVSSDSDPVTQSPTLGKKGISKHSLLYSSVPELDDKVVLQFDIYTLRMDSKLLEYLRYLFLHSKIYSLMATRPGERGGVEFSLPQTSIESLFKDIKVEIHNATELTTKFSVCKELIYAAQQYTHIYNLFWKDISILNKFLSELKCYLLLEHTSGVPNNRADEMEFVILLVTGIKHCMIYPCAIQTRANLLNSNKSLLKSIILVALTKPLSSADMSKQGTMDFKQLTVEYFRESISLLTILFDISTQSSWILSRPLSLTAKFIASLIESNFKLFFIVFNSVMNYFISLLVSDELISSLNIALQLYTFMKLIQYLHSSSCILWKQLIKSFSEEFRYYFNSSLLLSKLKQDKTVVQYILELSNWLHFSLQQHM